MPFFSPSRSGMALKKPDTQTGISSEKNHTILIKWLLKIENGKNNNNNNNDNNDNKKNKIKWKEENVCISSEKNHTILTKCLLKIENGQKKKKKKMKRRKCQKWDLNPRSLTRTRTWVWRLRPLGHPDYLVNEIQYLLYTYLT